MTEFFCARSGGQTHMLPRRMATVGKRRQTAVFQWNRAVFLDRDGVLNRDTGYVAHQRDMRFCHRVLPLLRWYHRKGYRMVVITNQSGVERGYCTIQNVIRCSRFLLLHLRRHGVPIDGMYFCPSQRDGDRYRKPRPGMLLAAAQKYHIDRSHSFLIGDRPSDMEAAKRAGLRHQILLPKHPGRLWRPRVYFSQRKGSLRRQNGD